MVIDGDIAFQEVLPTWKPLSNVSAEHRQPRGFPEPTPFSFLEFCVSHGIVFRAVGEGSTGAWYPGLLVKQGKDKWLWEGKSQRAFQDMGIYMPLSRGA